MVSLPARLTSSFYVATAVSSSRLFSAPRVDRCFCGRRPLRTLGALRKRPRSGATACAPGVPLRDPHVGTPHPPHGGHPARRMLQDRPAPSPLRRCHFPLHHLAGPLTRPTVVPRSARTVDTSLRLPIPVRQARSGVARPKLFRPPHPSRPFLPRRARSLSALQQTGSRDSAAGLCSRCFPLQARAPATRVSRGFKVPLCTSAVACPHIRVCIPPLRSARALIVRTSLSFPSFSILW